MTYWTYRVTAYESEDNLGNMLRCTAVVFSQDHLSDADALAHARRLAPNKPHFVIAAVEEFNPEIEQPALSGTTINVTATDTTQLGPLAEAVRSGALAGRDAMLGGQHEHRSPALLTE